MEFDPFLIVQDVLVAALALWAWRSERQERLHLQERYITFLENLAGDDAQKGKGA